MAADGGYGVQITFATSSFTAEIINDPQFSGQERTAIETTHHAVTNGWRTFIPGDLKDPGGFTFDINFDPDDQPPIAGAVETITIEFPVPSGATTGATLACSGFVTSWEAGSPIDDRMTASITVKFTGQPTWTDAA